MSDAGTPSGSTSVVDGSPPEETDPEGSVLLPLDEGDVPGAVLEIGRTVAAGADADLVVPNVVSVPRLTPLRLPEHLLAAHRTETRRVLDRVRAAAPSLSVTGTVYVGHRPSSILVDAADTYGADTVVLPRAWDDSRLSPLTRTPLETLLAGTDCSVAVPAGPLPETVSSVLVPVAGGPHSAAATDVAGAIARAHGAWVDLLHVVPDDDPDGHEHAEECLSAASARLADLDAVDTWTLEAPDVPEAIIEQSQYYGVTVVGAPRRRRLRQFLFGSTAGTVRDRSPDGLVTVWQ